MNKEEVYLPIDEVAMRAALTTSLADAFMVKLKRLTIPIFCKKWNLLNTSFHY